MKTWPKQKTVTCVSFRYHFKNKIYSNSRLIELLIKVHFLIQSCASIAYFTGHLLIVIKTFSSSCCYKYNVHFTSVNIFNFLHSLIRNIYTI